MSEYKVTVGKDFVIDAVEVSEDLIPQITNIVEEIEKVKTRRLIAVVAIVIICCALISATLIGCNDGSYNEVSTVWEKVQIPVGLILGYYFSGAQ